MTRRTRRGALTAALVAPLGSGTMRADAARADPGGGPDTVRRVARTWFAALAAGRLDASTHPGVVLVLHGWGAGLDGVPERFEGREAVAAVLAGAGPARWEVEDVLAGDERAALRGVVSLPDARTAAFAAFVTLREGRVVRVERHVDRILRRVEPVAAS